MAGPEFELLTAKNKLEGIDISIKPSIKGASIEKIHDLIDPSVSQEIDKKPTYYTQVKEKKELD